MPNKQADLAQQQKINLNIITPRGLKFAEQADFIVMRCMDGDLGVLPGHAPVSAVLGDGVLRFVKDGVEKKLAVFGGIVEIDETTVNILSTIAQPPEEIDLERAEADRREAEETMQEEMEELNVQGMQILLRRSLVRIEVSVHMDEDDGVDDDDVQEDTLS